jgi:hypothetical protein
MPPDTPEVNAEKAPDAAIPSGKVRLLRLEDCDRRTNAYRKCAEIIDRVERDLGGTNQLSEAQRQLVRHAALTATMLEHLGSQWLDGIPIDPSAFSTLVNAARRGFETVGLGRVAKEVVPTVDRYLAGEGKAGNPLNAVTDADRAQVILAVLAENPKMLDQILKQLT